MTEATVLALVRDLIFASKIVGSAQALGIPCRVVREAKHLSGLPGHLLLADLGQAGALEAARAWQEASGGRVIGYVAHVDGKTIAVAQAAGFERVLARSRFVDLLPQLLVC